MLHRGYSEKTIHANIREMYASGYSQRQAVAASLRAARLSFKKAHPKKAAPAHLRYARKG